MNISIKTVLLLTFTGLVILAGIALSTLNVFGIIGARNPILIKELKNNFEITDFTVNSKYAFLAYIEYDYEHDKKIPLNKGIKIFEISDKSNPILISSCNTPGGANCLAVKDKYIFAAGKYLQIIDISDIENPFITQSMELPGEVSKIEIIDNKAYFTTIDSFLVMDISNISSPEFIDEFKANDEIKDFCIDNNYAFLANWNNGAVILDVSREKIEKVSEYPGKIISSISADENYLYVLGNSLKVLDITDILNPVFLKDIPVSGYSYDIGVDNGIVYLLNGSKSYGEQYTGNLEIIKNHNTRDLKILASTTFNLDVLENLKMILKGNYAYIFGEKNGLKIFKLVNI
ncbi:MAG: LVIVD repeat-containing protein [Candidatus Humimicrobiaceae bacterium]